MDDFRYKMRALRKALGITQEEVGAVLGVSNVIVSLYERGLIDGSAYDASISQALNDIRAELVKRHGDWYNDYIDMRAATEEIAIRMRFDGNVPDRVIRMAKDCAVKFSEAGHGEY